MGDLMYLAVFVMWCILMENTVCHPSGSVEPENLVCRNLRANENLGNVISYHGVESDINISSILRIEITEHNEAVGDFPIGHHRYSVRLFLNEEISGMVGWMVQVRSYGKQNGINAGEIKGIIYNHTNSLHSSSWNCPLNSTTTVELPNGLVHKDSAYNNDPTTPNIDWIDFDYAPVQRNGTDSEGNQYFYSDIPKCGRILATIMVKGSLTWWHALESECFISTLQDGSPIPCDIDTDCQ